MNVLAQGLYTFDVCIVHHFVVALYGHEENEHGGGKQRHSVTKCLLHFAEIANGGILHAVCQHAVQTCLELHSRGDFLRSVLHKKNIVKIK